MRGMEISKSPYIVEIDLRCIGLDLAEHLHKIFIGLFNMRLN